MSVMDACNYLSINVDDLRASMRFMVHKGIEPSVDNLARLAEQYNAVQGPVNKGQLLLQSFGRMGFGMCKSMEMGASHIRKYVQDNDLQEIIERIPTVFNFDKSMPPIITRITNKAYCHYCNGNTIDDRRGNCGACGAPR
jgi:hypothetical protein